MTQRICPNCGKQFSAQITICPRCDKALALRNTSYDIDLQREHLLLYEYVLPAAEDPNKLSLAESKIKHHLEKYRTLLSHRACDVLQNTMLDCFRDANSSWKYEKQQTSEQLNLVLASIHAALNQKSSYNGLGFSVITDASGAVAYAALDAVQGHIHDVTQTKAAYQKALTDISSYCGSADYSHLVKPIFESIDRVIWHLRAMLKGKQIVEELRDFYSEFANEAKDIDKNVVRALCNAAQKNEFVGWIYSADAKQQYLRMEATGYIQVFFHRKGVAEFYCSTGKLESKLLEDRYFKEHPEKATAEKKSIAENTQSHYVQAETSFKNKKYYRAAIHYAQIPTDRAALRRSINIWDQYLMDPLPHTGGYWLNVNGEPQYIYHNISINIPYNENMDVNVRYKKLHGCSNGHGFVGLSLDGRIYSSVKNLYEENKPSRGEIGTTYLPGNGTDWINICDTACSGEHLIGLRQDGTALALGCNTSGQCNVTDWTEIVSIAAATNSTAALRKDGSVLLAGDVVKYASEVAKWPKMKRLYLREAGIAGLSLDGQVMIAAKTAFDTQAVARWRNVIRLDWFDDGIFGINDTGDILCTNEEPITEALCKNLSGTVRILLYKNPKHNYFEEKPALAALRADGTIFVSGMGIDLSDWQSIVDANYHYSYIKGDNFTAINAQGQFLFYGQDFSDLERNYQFFSHIDTIQEERKESLRNALSDKQKQLAKTKGLFAGKQRKSIQASIDFLQNKLETTPN